MLYCTFLFWFWYRLGLALLAHFNWAASIYFGCLYFSLWKSYDLLWFWMHLILCVCFPTLQSDNYLLVWFTIINKKLRKCPEKSLKQIYEESYRRMRKRAKTAYELAMKEKVAHYDEDDNISRDSDVESCGKSADGGSAVVKLYPALKTAGESDSVASFNIAKEAKPHQTELLKESHATLADESNAATTMTGEASEATATTAAADNNSVANKSIDILTPDFKNKYDAVVKEADAVSKELKREKKALEKRLRKEHKAELARRAKEEAKRQAVADAISFLLFLLRLRATFSILIGNIRKNFIGAQFKSDLSVSSINALALLLRATIFIDIILFWFTCQWAYLRQCRLFCQLGVFRFWLWAAVLLTVGGLFMELPMYWVQHHLDSSWCEFNFE